MKKLSKQIKKLSKFLGLSEDVSDLMNLYFYYLGLLFFLLYLYHSHYKEIGIISLFFEYTVGSEFLPLSFLGGISILLIFACILSFLIVTPLVLINLFIKFLKFFGVLGKK